MQGGPKTKGSNCGVQVITWGSHDLAFGEPENTGNQAFLITPNLAGSNVGHAAMLLRIPDTPANRQLTEVTLNANGEKSKIPVAYKTYSTPSLVGFDENRHPIYGDKPAYEEKVIEVYFSWWPGHQGYHFNTFEEDTVSERLGVNTEYDPRWREYLEPEQRRTTTGLLSKVKDDVITLGPAQVGHLRGYTALEQRVLTQYQNLLTLNSEYSAISLLISKLNKNKDKPEITLDTSEALLLKRFLTYDNSQNKIRPKDVLPLLIAKREILHREIARSKVDYVGSLIQLNGKEQLIANNALSTAEKKDYAMVDKLRQFIKLGETYDPNKATTKDTLILNKIYKELFAAQYDIVVKELPSLVLQAKADPLLKSGATIKGDFNSVLEASHNIATLKDLHHKLNLYQGGRKNKATNCDDLREEFINALRQYEDLAKKYMDNNEFDDKYLEALAERIDEALDPLSSADYQKFNEMVNTRDLIKGLSAEKAERLINDSVTHGHAPDHIVNLPLQTDQHPGLDIRAMLKAMADKAMQGKEFELFTNNCADNCGDILAAGAGSNAHVFQHKAFNDTMANPQMTYNNAVTYSASFASNLQPEQRSYYLAVQKYLTELSLLSYASMDNKKSTLTNATYFLATLATAIPAGILSAPAATADALGWGKRKKMVFSQRPGESLQNLAGVSPQKTSTVEAQPDEVKPSRPTKN